MTLFERYRRALASAPFPPAQEAQFHLQTAESYEALSLPDAGAHRRRARARASPRRYGFNKVALRGGGAAGARGHGCSACPSRAPESSIPEPLQEIASTIARCAGSFPVERAGRQPKPKLSRCCRSCRSGSSYRSAW